MKTIVLTMYLWCMFFPQLHQNYALDKFWPVGNGCRIPCHHIINYFSEFCNYLEFVYTCRDFHTFPTLTLRNKISKSTTNLTWAKVMANVVYHITEPSDECSMLFFYTRWFDIRLKLYRNNLWVKQALRKQKSQENLSKRPF